MKKKKKKRATVGGKRKSALSRVLERIAMLEERSEEALGEVDNEICKTGNRIIDRIEKLEEESDAAWKEADNENNRHIAEIARLVAENERLGKVSTEQRRLLDKADDDYRRLRDRNLELRDRAEAFSLLELLRREGWNVAVHNDYRLNNERKTFWLFTRGHQCFRGEGATDLEAIHQVSHAISEDAISSAGADEIEEMVDSEILESLKAEAHAYCGFVIEKNTTTPPTYTRCTNPRPCPEHDEVERLRERLAKLESGRPQLFAGYDGSHECEWCGKPFSEEHDPECRVSARRATWISSIPDDAYQILLGLPKDSPLLKWFRCMAEAYANAPEGVPTLKDSLIASLKGQLKAREATIDQLRTMRVTVGHRAMAAGGSGS